MRKNSISLLLQITGITLSLLSVAVSSFVLFITRPVVIKRPVILLLASIFGLINFRKLQSLALLQKIVMLYLICVLFNQLSLQFVHFPLGQTRITFPASLGFLSLLLIGYILINRAQCNWLITTRNKGLFLSWGTSFVIIVVHVLLLILMLKKFYGHGYEHDLNVLGSLSLYFLVFFFSWPLLDVEFFRKVSAAVFAALYICLIAVEGWQ